MDVRAFGSWMSAPKRLFFQDFEGLTEVFAPGCPPGYPRGRPLDIRPQNLLFGLLFRSWQLGLPWASRGGAHFLPSVRKLEKAVAVRNSLLEKFSGKFQRCCRAFLKGGDLNPGERHSRDTRDDGTVTFCTLRAATVLSRDCRADFGRPLTKKVMSHLRDGPHVTAPSRTNIVPLTRVWNPPPSVTPP